MILLAVLSLLFWLYLITAHGQFWQSGPVLGPDRPRPAPAVAVVVPARDEAPFIGASLRSLLAQDYPGPFRIVLVDDSSADGTGGIARALADPRLTVLTGQPRPAGWSGKLWALAQGIAEVTRGPLLPELILLTDADIVHDPRHVSALVAQAERQRLDLVSEMVTLSCVSPAERALVPAFVFFFQLLYPFARVNDPMRATAAAAGGTILVRSRALDRIGGIEAIRGALIDDVALAAAVKKGGRIWLGHAALARSVRPYPGFLDIWQMVSRTAYVQLRYSPLLLALTTLGMALTFLTPPLAACFGHGPARWIGLAGWAGMAAAYLPTLRRFRRSPLWPPLLPAVAAFYMAATIGSALNHLRGRGVAWKGRAYQGADA
jgi:hopene-associated glycosyltransferase HpnB